MQSKCYKSEEFHVAQSAVSENGHSMRDAHTSVFHLLGGGGTFCVFLPIKMKFGTVQYT